MNGLLGVIQKQATKSVTIRANVVETVDLQLAYAAPTLPDLGQPQPIGDGGRLPTILK